MFPEQKFVFLLTSFLSPYKCFKCSTSQILPLFFPFIAFFKSTARYVSQAAITKCHKLGVAYQQQFVPQHSGGCRSRILAHRLVLPGALLQATDGPLLLRSSRVGGRPVSELSSFTRAPPSRPSISRRPPPQTIAAMR